MINAMWMELTTVLKMGLDVFANQPMKNLIARVVRKILLGKSVIDV